MMKLNTYQIDELLECLRTGKVVHIQVIGVDIDKESGLVDVRFIMLEGEMQGEDFEETFMLEG